MAEAFQPALPWEAEKKRLSAQANRIVELLRERPRTNDELSRVSRKYTSRISDIRKAGYDIRCVHHNHETGVTVYQIFEGL